ncbi:MAG: DUF502 domain-containing protein [Planctomycetes bacterium]|nr:DUF502 domain-containing protein [Planctomycetota bacterium]
MTFRRAFLTGLAAVLPILVTLFLLYTFFGYVDAITQPLTDRLLGLLGATDWHAPFPTLIWIAGVFCYLLFMIGLIYLIGRLVASYLGGLLFQWFENVFLKLPVVRAIYPYAKQVTDYFFSDKVARFHHVVAVQYPRKGVYSVGFLTGDSMDQIQEAETKKFVNVFVPSSPTPFTGYVVFVPEDELIHLGITVDQALRLTVSGGVIVPPHKGPPPVSGPPTTPPSPQETAHATTTET